MGKEAKISRLIINIVLSIRDSVRLTRSDINRCSEMVSLIFQYRIRVVRVTLRLAGKPYQDNVSY